MKRFFSYILMAAASALVMAAGKVHYTDASSLKLIGRGIDPQSSADRYQRLPDSVKESLPRPFLWTLGKNTAGQALRFATDSPLVNVRWRSTQMTRMNHFAPTGIRGLDLYCLMPDSTWRFVNSARPDLDNDMTETTIISNMEPQMREYMLFLPLYDGVSDLAIGIGDGYTIAPPSSALPCQDRPIVAYGTSILQGGCASRPGMAHTNILTRRLNRQVINFGFSGNGQLDLEIAPVVAAVENPSLFILDFCPNVNNELIEEKMIPFFDIIRSRHPDVPVLFVENPVFPHSAFDLDIARKITSRNAALKAKFDALTARGEKNIYYLPSDGLIGNDGEATVDGIHFTDLGFSRYADILVPLIRSILSTQPITN